MNAVVSVPKLGPSTHISRSLALLLDLVWIQVLNFFVGKFVHLPDLNLQYVTISSLYLVLGVLYFGVTEGMFGQSLSKAIVRMKVVQVDGSEMSFRTGVIGAFLSLSILLVIPLVIPLLNSDHRAIHDFLTGTKVVGGEGADGDNDGYY